MPSGIKQVYSDKPMNIGIFSLAYVPFVGGAELAIKEITDRVAGQFTCFTMRFNRAWSKHERVGNVDVVRLGSGKTNGDYYGKNKIQKFLYILRAYKKAEELHRHNNFTAIWAVMASHSGFAALLFKLRHPEIKFLLTLQEGDSEKHILDRLGIFYPIWRLIFKKADHIQAISSYLANFAIRHGAMCPIEIVPNGVAADKIISQIKTNEHQEKIIITTSRLVYKNGIDLLIRAAAELKKSQIPNLKFQILGSGPLEVELKRLAKNLAVDDVIDFLGHIEPEQIFKYLSQADIFVRPSRSEGLGSSFLEAMAAGLPIIGTPVGGITDFLIDQETGLFAETENYQDLAVKLRLLLEGLALRKKLAEKGLALIKKSYQWDTIVNKMQSIFNKILIQKKILIATGIFPPAIGGSASYSALLKKELPEHSFQILILTYGDKRDHKSSEKNIFIVSNRWSKGIRHLIYFLKVLVLGRDADVILAADSSFGAALIVALANKILGTKLIIRVTGDYAWEQGKQRFAVQDSIDDFQNKKYGWSVEFLRKCQKYALNSADLIVAPSQYLKNIVIGWGINPEKITVIYNGIVQPLITPKLQARQELGLIENDKIAISAGRLVSWKGFAALIEVTAEIVKKIPKFKLIIIGDGPEKSNLKFKIANLKLETSVYLIGSVAKDKLNNYLSAADIFVLNTGYEGLSHQLLEALSAGLQIITTDAGGNKEIIDEIIKTQPDLIRIVPYNNRSTMQLVLEHELASINKTRLSEKELTDMMRKFSKDQMINNLVNLLK